MNRIIQTVFICLLTLLPFSTAHALDDQQELLRNAVQAVEDIIHSEDEHVPTELLSKAKAIIIFPKMLKGGFIFAARYGQGVISTRSKQPDCGDLRHSSTPPEPVTAFRSEPKPLICSCSS